MTSMKSFFAATTAIAFLGVPSAYAQHRGGGGHGGGGGHASGGSVHQAAPRSSGGSVHMAPRRYAGAPRAYGSVRSVAPRSYSSAAPRGFAAPRSFAAQRGGVIGRGAPRAFSPRVIGPRGFGGGGVYRFSRPYYAFRPRLSLGFGLWVGFPVAYPYYDGYDPDYYPYGYSYPYGYATRYPPYGYSNAYPPYPPTSYPQSYPAYPPSGSVGVQPGQPQGNIGGVSFDITPSNAEIVVDGESMGIVADFSPTAQPLGLEPGRHHIEVRASGYRTMEFDVDIVARQVIPYQGSLQR